MSLTYKETANQIIITLNTEAYYRQVAFKKSQFVGYKLRYDKHSYDDNQLIEFYLHTGTTVSMAFISKLEDRYHWLCEQLNGVLDMNEKKNA